MDTDVLKTPSTVNPIGEEITRKERDANTLLRCIEYISDWNLYEEHRTEMNVVKRKYLITK